MRYRVEITEHAWSKIRDQARYIAGEAGAPVNAGRWLARVLDAIDTLEQYPRRCPEAIENAFFSFQLRSLNVDGFLLLFTIDDENNVVQILHARHGRQRPIDPDRPEA